MSTVCTVTGKTGENPAQAYPYCKTDEDSGYHWFKRIGKVLSEDEVKPGYQSDMDIKVQNRFLGGESVVIYYDCRISYDAGRFFYTQGKRFPNLSKRPDDWHHPVFFRLIFIWDSRMAAQKICKRTSFLLSCFQMVLICEILLLFD